MRPWRRVLFGADDNQSIGSKVRLGCFFEGAIKKGGDVEEFFIKSHRCRDTRKRGYVDLEVYNVLWCTGGTENRGIVGLIKEEREMLRLIMTDGYSLNHLPHAFSDHYLVLIDLGDNSRDGMARGKVGFKFNANWILEEWCEQQVMSFWEVNTKEIPMKLEKLGSVIKNKKGRNFTSKRQASTVLSIHLAYLSLVDLDDETLADLEEVKLALNLEVDKEELFWEQRAKTNWLRFGDRNISYFHNLANKQIKKNTMKKLKEPNEE
ncbi:hypothetical protein PVK06_028509 [Gossypium arboreum]|uniref:Reverse transcriptase n=1 Tax=Gossypium arboreum TaxID=29729 RepID=A0ABR0P3E9_GOSAR|nr:hypothetical protein PVK06_028509 [Gossypium arboreum]